MILLLAQYVKMATDSLLIKNVWSAQTTSAPFAHRQTSAQNVNQAHSLLRLLVLTVSAAT